MGDKKHGKRVNWEFDGVDTIRVGDGGSLDELEKKFTFHLERNKDELSHEESLTISCYMEGTDNGVVETTISDLDTDFKKFMRYGVAFNDIVTYELKAKIKEIYLQLTPHYVKAASDEDRLTDLLYSVGEYISAIRDKKDNGPFPELLYVPVGEFNEMAKDSGYKEYETKDLRDKLASLGYIRVRGNRYAIVARIKDKPTRAIAFIYDKVKEYILDSGNNESGATSADKN